MTLFVCCQPDAKQLLSNREKRNAIMDTIANNGYMVNEMMTAMMQSPNHKTLMVENHRAMMNMIKHDPIMLKDMMIDMRDACKSDSVMMYSMCKTMMNDPQMKEMMLRMDMMHEMDGMESPKLR
jgi:hypothetical protein